MPHQLNDRFNDECGVFGVFLNRPALETDAAHTAFYGLYALQHRGQESAGIAVSDGKQIRLQKDMGLLVKVFDLDQIDKLTGHIAVGHVRYSTSGESSVVNSQPMVFHYMRGMVALAYNGNLLNASKLRERLGSSGSVFQTTTDAEVIANLLACYSHDRLDQALSKCLTDLKGGYALVVTTGNCLMGARDPMGIRPLCLGELHGNYVLASESAALDIVGATLVRDVKPGEIVVIDEDGLHSIEYMPPPRRATCVFEYVYFARPDSTIDEINVYQARRAMGRQLARECNIVADMVVSVPDSGTTAALGYAEGSGLPFHEGLIKNRYVGRTFIQPSQKMRETSVRIKLNALSKVVKGQRVVMVDDSIVRGTTSKQIVQMLRDAGASEVHMAVASPPTRYSCFYGIDTSKKEELIANNMSVAEIEAFIGADSLHYLSIEGMFKALRGGTENYCAACFSGDYPLDIEG